MGYLIYVLHQPCVNQSNGSVQSQKNQNQKNQNQKNQSQKNHGVQNQKNQNQKNQKNHVNFHSHMNPHPSQAHHPAVAIHIKSPAVERNANMNQPKPNQLTNQAQNTVGKNNQQQRSNHKGRRLHRKISRR